MAGEYLQTNLLNTLDKCVKVVYNITIYTSRRVYMVSNVLTYLKASYEKYPQKTALSDACSSVSYSELWEKACAIGSAISRLMNGTSGEPVFVCIDRRIESIIAFFGVVCSGNFYVPIDPSLPEKRLEDIFNTMQPKLCIASVELKKPLPFE